MGNQKYNFQYCQKIVILSKDKTKVLLAKRKGEEDFDGIYSFIGGKMETGDTSIISGLKREKDEEIGIDCKLNLFVNFSHNLEYITNAEDYMILPHYLAIYESGEIKLNEEYSDYKWIEISKLDNFEPKIKTILNVVNKILELEKISKEKDFILI
ncbi:MAG: NUDIX hydrolase [Nanoarchaeales archaeon]|nr:NUDIX hydrolase [Nanoarchaeales archaeon]